MARSAPVASAARSVISVSFGPKVTTTTSPARVFGCWPFSVRRRAASRAYSSNGFGFHSRPVVSTLSPAAGIFTLLALSGSATRLRAHRVPRGHEPIQASAPTQARHRGAQAHAVREPLRPLAPGIDLRKREAARG